MPKFLNKFDKGSESARLPFLVLAVSVLLTIGVAGNFYQSSKNKDNIRFANEVERVQMALESRINLYVALLKGGRGFVESNREVTRRNFTDYVKSLELDKNYTGVQGIGYAKVVPAAERGAFAEKMKSEGYENFNLFPTDDKDFYRVVAYLEPLDEANQKTIGFDMSSEANRLEALDRARDSGAAASSAKVKLIQQDGTDSQAGFLIFLPIYKNGKLPATIDERRRDLTGYIYSPFQAKEFLGEIKNDKFAPGIVMKIFDGEPTAQNLMEQTADAQSAGLTNRMGEQHFARKEINVAGRNWIIEYYSSPTFAAQSSIGWTPLIFAIGALGSFLLFGMFYWETAARIKLQKTAAELFVTEQQKQGLLEKEQKARLSAEQANKTKDEFIAVVSHELRTPLNAIGGWTRILKTGDLSDNTKNLALDKIDKNLRSQTKMVEELLEYSQIVSGTTNFEGRDVCFADIFENTFSEIEPAAQEKSIEFLKDNQLDCQLVLGDEDKIKLVIYNVLTNAIKFTHSGGRIETAVCQCDGTIRMTVKDNGKGINPKFLPDIFDRFTQADASTTRASGGLGLGLTICSHILKLHNGTIEAASEGEGKGSVFTIDIPLKTLN